MFYWGSTWVTISSSGPGVVMHTFVSSLWVWGQLGLCGKFQVSQAYIVRPCSKTSNQTCHPFEILMQQFIIHTVVFRTCGPLVWLFCLPAHYWLCQSEDRGWPPWALCPQVVQKLWRTRYRLPGTLSFPSHCSGKLQLCQNSIPLSAFALQDRVLRRFW